MQELLRWERVRSFLEVKSRGKNKPAFCVLLVHPLLHSALTSASWLHGGGSHSSTAYRLTNVRHVDEVARFRCLSLYYLSSSSCVVFYAFEYIWTKRFG